MNDSLQDSGCIKKEENSIHIHNKNKHNELEKLSARPWIFRFLHYSHPLTPTIKLKPISDFKYIIYVTVNSKVNTIFFSEYAIIKSAFFKELIQSYNRNTETLTHILQHCLYNSALKQYMF